MHQKKNSSLLIFAQKNSKNKNLKKFSWLLRKLFHCYLSTEEKNISDASINFNKIQILLSRSLHLYLIFPPISIAMYTYNFFEVFSLLCLSLKCVTSANGIEIICWEKSSSSSLWQKAKKNAEIELRKNWSRHFGFKFKMKMRKKCVYIRMEEKKRWWDGFGRRRKFHNYIMTSEQANANERVSEEGITRAERSVQ